MTKKSHYTVVLIFLVLFVLLIGYREKEISEQNPTRTPTGTPTLTPTPSITSTPSS
jgi:hypothetical protein